MLGQAHALPQGFDIEANGFSVHGSGNLSKLLQT
jgi:hypothetical protein